MKTTVYTLDTLPAGPQWDALRADALNAMEEGDYATAFGLHNGQWESFSDPGDAFLEVEHEDGYCDAAALIAHNDVLRIIVTERN